jgi:hypothetical protein
MQLRASNGPVVRARPGRRVGPLLSVGLAHSRPRRGPGVCRAATGEDERIKATLADLDALLGIQDEPVRDKVRGGRGGAQAGRGRCRGRGGRPVGAAGRGGGGVGEWCARAARRVLRAAPLHWRRVATPPPTRPAAHAPRRPRAPPPRAPPCRRLPPTRLRPRRARSAPRRCRARSPRRCRSSSPRRASPTPSSRASSRSRWCGARAGAVAVQRARRRAAAGGRVLAHQAAGSGGASSGGMRDTLLARARCAAPPTARRQRLPLCVSPGPPQKKILDRAKALADEQAKEGAAAGTPGAGDGQKQALRQDFENLLNIFFAGAAPLGGVAGGCRDAGRCGGGGSCACRAASARRRGPWQMLRRRRPRRPKPARLHPPSNPAPRNPQKASRASTSRTCRSSRRAACSGP